MSVPWIPILSAGASLLGSLFGNQKNTTQSENSTTAGTTTGVNKTELEATTTQNTTQTQNSNQSSSQASTQDVNQQISEQQTGNLTRLDAQTLDMLTQAVQGGLADGSSLDILRRRMSELEGNTPAFDSAAYVEDIMSSARSDMASQIESAMGRTEGRVGASGKKNSAAALLNAKVAQQGAASLAGIKGDAIAKAEQLRQSQEAAKTGQLTDLAAATEAGSTSLLNALLQARETQTQQTTGTQNQQTTGTTAGTTTGTTTMTGTTTEQMEQEQKQATSETTASQTRGNVSQKENALNWGDLFTNIGKIFSTSF